MNIRRPFERARRLSRSFVFTCCVVAVSSGVAFAQTNAANGDSRDARLLKFLAGNGNDSARTAPSASSQTRTATVPTFKESAESPIRQARAAYPASQPAPIRQARYAAARDAESTTAQYSAAPLAPSASQLALGGGAGELDKPYVDACPDPKDMPSILDVPYKIVPKPGLFPENCPLPDEDYRRKAPTPITFTWKASSLCYKPLYFEDVQLERYGHYCHPLLQPIASRVRFWLTIPILPYLAGVNPPQECVYDLGYYRPGNCAPSMLQPVPISLRGGLLEAGAIVGAAAIIP